MSERILITGGAGFVGSHLADALIGQGYRVKIVDSLDTQVHPAGEWPDYLDSRVEKIHGDVRDERVVKQALKDVDAVFHFAAAVGVGQSMYKINHYTQVNNVGTSNLLEALINQPVKKLIVASSMSLYGEGAYLSASGEYVEPSNRALANVERDNWELKLNGRELYPIATPETKTPAPSSVYALSKYDQEQLCLMTGNAYNIPTSALRFFNIYGTRQALANPYTGVLAIFSSRYLNNRPPLIFEDGKQRRDFVSIHDITQFCVRALESDAANGEVFNVGSGSNYTILEVAEKIGRLLDKEELMPSGSGKYRVGDVRHCFADITKGKNLLGYFPRVDLEDGLAELSDWLQAQDAPDHLETMRTELADWGLSR